MLKIIVGMFLMFVLMNSNLFADITVGGDDIIHKSACDKKYCDIEVRVWKYKDKTYFIVTSANGGITMVPEVK